jgi:hypothetical protein
MTDRLDSNPHSLCRKDAVFCIESAPTTRRQALLASFAATVLGWLRLDGDSSKSGDNTKIVIVDGWVLADTDRVGLAPRA